MMLQINEIERLYNTCGTRLRPGEAIDQRQHALQCASLAQREGRSHELITAALLHDFGHLLVSYAEPLPDGADDGHEYAAIPFLRGLFPDAVLEPIRMHVQAKRYLCAMDPAYRAALPGGAKRSLLAQGGPFSASEAAQYIRRPFARDALALRRWDDQAMAPDANPPDWSHFRAALESARLPTPACAS
jgi:phosphonate degradation associated HDIG domain protein